MTETSPGIQGKGKGAGMGGDNPVLQEAEGWRGVLPQVVFISGIAESEKDLHKKSCLWITS